MILDVHTLILVHSLSLLMQAATLAAQARAGQRPRGADWWAGGSLVAAFALALSYVRDLPALGTFAILASNVLLISGTVLYRIGFRNYIGKPLSRRGLAAYALLVSLGTSCFTLVRDDADARRLIILPAMALLHFLNAGDLFRSRRDPGARAPRTFVASVALFHGGFYLVTCVAILREAPAPDLFAPSFSTTFPFLISFLTTNLMTYGLITLVNRELNAENREEKKKLASIFAATPDAILISTRDEGRIEEVNEAFTAFSGYERSAVIGKTSLEIGLWVDAEARRNLVGGLGAPGASASAEASIRRQDGSLITALISARELELHGKACIISVARDISERKRDEERLRALLAEKELLLREVHHRIKNNMSVVGGMLELQAAGLTDRSAIAALEDAQARVKSMMLLYDQLYQSTEAGSISMKDYLPALVEQVIANFPARERIRAITEVEDFQLDARALSGVGIIVNELLTNAMKYAFRGRETGTIRVTAATRGKDRIIAVEDDGVGIPEAALASGAESFGLGLVRILAEQIRGRLRFEPIAGTRVVLELPGE
jgi:PAS domain S-box-containing protein